MKTLKVKLTLLEEMLGTASANPEIHAEYIASKGPNAKTLAEEVEAIGNEAAMEKAMTVFPRGKDGRPVLWDYQVKGFFKDACRMEREVPGSESSNLKAYKKKIDGLIFVLPRMIPIRFDGDVGDCQRPLRADTAQGPRVCLASSETVPAGATMEFEILCKLDAHVAAVKEWLNSGVLRGLGQWRNSGKGRFSCELIEERNGFPTELMEHNEVHAEMTA